MFTISSTLLSQWLFSTLLPFTRILGMLVSAPIFAHQGMPTRFKIALALAIAWLITPQLGLPVQIDLLNAAGILILAQQFAIGLLIGFVMRLIFAVFEIVGDLCSLTMGIGFAVFFDPQTHGNSTALSQFFVMLVTLIFLSINGHLSLITAVCDSLNQLPIMQMYWNANLIEQLLNWSSIIFSSALKMSLPILSALLMTNMVLGILTRAAPQLNIFAIGFPLTLSAGFLVLIWTVPYLKQPIESVLISGLAKVAQLWQ